MKSLVESLNENIINEGFLQGLKEFAKQIKATVKILKTAKYEFAKKLSDNPNLTIGDYLDWVTEMFANEIKDFKEFNPDELIKTFIDGQEKQLNKLGFSRNDLFSEIKDIK